jgi:branched-chain amino acid transport system substrate-binding protein
MHHHRTIALLGVLALAVAGCGGNAGTGEPRQAATASEAARTTPADHGDGRLVVGALLPETGDLASVAPAESAGAEAAVDDINAAGGVLHHPVTLVEADSGDQTTNIAGAAVDRLLARRSDVVLAGASSAISLSVLDRVTGAGVPLFSPSNTSPVFDEPETDPHDLYFRTAPSDVLQGSVLATAVLDAGHHHVAVLAREDSWGKQLSDELEKEVVAGGGELTAKLLYPPGTTSFSSLAVQIRSTHPDAIVVIGFDETRRIIPALADEGIGPRHQQIYLVDGNTSDYSSYFPAGTMTGVEGMHPGEKLSSAFEDKLRRIDPELTDFTYGPETYDATVLTALAVEAAGSDAPERYAPEILEVSRDGQKCTSFASCSALVKRGKNIDYDGESGPVDLDDSGSPSEATITLVRYTSSNAYHDIGHVTGPT